MYLDQSLQRSRTAVLIDLYQLISNTLTMHTLIKIFEQNTGAERFCFSPSIFPDGMKNLALLY